MNAPDVLDPERIRHAANWPDLHVEVIDEVDSTNRALMEKRFGPQPAPALLLVARRQTQGRGRRGRDWLSEAGRSLALSVAVERLVRPGAVAAGGLPIAVGVSLCEALAAWAPDLGLKWPNDLQREGRKVGGVLCEARSGAVDGARIERVVVGVGINLVVPQDLDGAIAQPVAGLFDAVPDDPGAACDVAGAVAHAVLLAAGGLFEHGLAAFAAGFEQYDVLQGVSVKVSPGGSLSPFEGTAAGIDEDGALRVQTAAGLQRVMAADVSVRRIPGS